MKLQRVMLLALGTIALGACDDDDESTFQPGPAALVRYINAVPDTLALDFLIVDNPLEPLPSFKGVAFRGSSGAGYHRVTPGDRDVRIFLSGTDLDVVTNVLVDTTINFVANQRYTIMHVGSARAGTDGIIVFEDELPTPEGSLSIRAFHAVEGVGPVDVHVADGTAAAPAGDPVGAAVATISNVPYRSWSAYTTVPTRAAEAGNLYTLAATATGTGTVAFSSTPNLPGIPETNSVSAQGGVQIPGSVLSAVLFPGVPADAPQATAGNANPAIVLFNERQFQ